MKTLTTPIVVQNITRWKVIRLRPDHDDACPNYLIDVQVLGAGGITYGVFVLKACDTANSTKLLLNPSPAGYGDKVLTGVADIPGAYTAIKNADEGATGNRAAHWLAVENILQSCGLVDASLAAT